MILLISNLWGSRSAPDSALLASLNDALEPQGGKAVLTRLGKPVKRLKASAGLPGIHGSVEAELASPKGDSAAAMREVMKQLDRQKKPLLLAIDEAQVLASTAHSDFAHMVPQASQGCLVARQSSHEEHRGASTATVAGGEHRRPPGCGALSRRG